MGKRVEIGETIVKKITRDEFNAAKDRKKKDVGNRVVKCDRCGATLFDGTDDELAGLATEWTEMTDMDEVRIQHGTVQLVCSNEEFIDPRKPRRETIVNEDGDEEVVEVERLKRCTNVATVAVESEVE